jgi:sarcosine oxidase subunit gamma
MVEIAARRAPLIPTTPWMRALPAATRLAFYGDAKARAAALSAWGVEFSEEACRARGGMPRATLWLGPDEYLLIDGGTSAAWGAPVASNSTAALVAALETALADLPHALVDVSHRQCAVELSGAHAANILNGACPLDLDIAEFPVGMCTRTVLAKAEIVLWRVKEDVFHVEFWRSFAGYVTALLAEIAAEFYG